MMRRHLALWIALALPIGVGLVVSTRVLHVDRGDSDAEAVGGGAASSIDVRLSGEALTSRLQTPPPDGLPGGWRYHNSIQVAVPSEPARHDNTANPERIHADEVESWLAEQAALAMSTDQPRSEGIRGSLYLYAPDGPIGTPESYLLKGDPFMAAAVFPKQTSSRFVDQMTSLGLKVRSLSSADGDVLVVSAAAVPDVDVDTYVQTVLGVKAS
jgi:hypothetical protein